MSRSEIIRLRRLLAPTAEELRLRDQRVGGPKIIAGISQLELGRRLGLSQRTVQGWEMKHRPRKPNGPALILMNLWYQPFVH